MSTLRVMIADDHTLVREGIRALLTKLPDVDVVAELLMQIDYKCLRAAQRGLAFSIRYPGLMRYI